MKKATFTLLAAGGMVAAGAGLANADASNVAISGNNNGVMSGFILQGAQDQPLTNCADSSSAWLSLLTTNVGNECSTRH
jgi:hypothetical protein